MDWHYQPGQVPVGQLGHSNMLLVCQCDTVLVLCRQAGAAEILPDEATPVATVIVLHEKKFLQTCWLDFCASTCLSQSLLCTTPYQILSYCNATSITIPCTRQCATSESQRR